MLDEGVQSSQAAVTSFVVPEASCGKDHAWGHQHGTVAVPPQPSDAQVTCTDFCSESPGKARHVAGANRCKAGRTEIRHPVKRNSQEVVRFGARLSDPREILQLGEGRHRHTSLARQRTSREGFLQGNQTQP